jgi:ATP-dependent Zn protease
LETGRTLAPSQVAPDVDLMQLSRDLPGLVGADLANIVNEAQMSAVRAGRDAITARDMYAGVDRFTQVSWRVGRQVVRFTETMGRLLNG